MRYPSLRGRKATIGAAALAALAVLASLAVISQAARPTEHDVDLRVRAIVLKTSADGSRCRLVGDFKGSPLGSGAYGSLVVVSGADRRARAVTEMVLKGGTYYNKRGSLSGDVRARATDSGACGRTSFRGTAENLSGTGAYDGATGRLRLTGTYETGTGTLTFRVTGTVEY